MICFCFGGHKLEVNQTIRSTQGGRLAVRPVTVGTRVHKANVAIKNRAVRQQTTYAKARKKQKKRHTANLAYKVSASGVTHHFRGATIPSTPTNWLPRRLQTKPEQTAKRSKQNTYARNTGEPQQKPTHATLASPKNTQRKRNTKQTEPRRPHQDK